MNNVVDMNVIVLEGVGLYIVLGIILFTAIASCVLAITSIATERKVEDLQLQLDAEREKNTKLQVAYGRLDFKYKLKSNLLETYNTGDKSNG